MQLNTQAIKKCFEKSMDKYDQNAFVQKNMAENLVFNLLNVRKDFDVIVELGSGTGLLSELISENFIFKKYYANDLVGKSKIYISKFIPDAQFILGNAVKIKIPEKSDLVISNAMFQWFNNLKTVTDLYKSVLNNDGLLAFSTFGPKNFVELKHLSGLTLNYYSKDEIIKILKPDFEILYLDEYCQVVNFENPLALLAHMKNTGVNSLSAKTWNIKDVKNFCDNYIKSFDSVHITYNPIIVIAKIK